MTVNSNSSRSRSTNTPSLTRAFSAWEKSLDQCLVANEKLTQATSAALGLIQSAITNGQLGQEISGRSTTARGGSATSAGTGGLTRGQKAARTRKMNERKAARQASSGMNGGLHSSLGSNQSD